MKVVKMLKKRYPNEDIETELKENMNDCGFSNIEIEELNKIVLSVVGNKGWWNLLGKVDFSISENCYAEIWEFAERKEYPVYCVCVKAETANQIYESCFALMPFGCCEVFGGMLNSKHEIQKTLTKEIKRLMLDRNGDLYKVANNEFYKAEKNKQINDADREFRIKKEQAEMDCSYNSYTIN